MLTPDLRPLMGLPSPSSPNVSLFPTHERPWKSQDPQVSEVDPVDPELLTPNGVTYPPQKSDSPEQPISPLPLVKSSVEEPPTPELVFKDSQNLTETLREELDALESALAVSDTNPAAQDTIAPPLISTTSESQVATLLGSDTTFDERSQVPSTLEESQAFDDTDEWVTCTLQGSYLKLRTSAGNSKATTFTDSLFSPMNLI
jgi:hypothetical protein